MNSLMVPDGKGGQIQVSRDLYTYQTKVATLAASGTATITIDIEADSSFIWLKTTFSVTANTAATRNTEIIPAVTVQINDTGSGRLLQQEPVQISDMAGSGILPFILPVPRTFKPKSTIQVTFINKDTVAQVVDLSLVFHGYKQWRL